MADMNYQEFLVSSNLKPSAAAKAAYDEAIRTKSRSVAKTVIAPQPTIPGVNTEVKTEIKKPTSVLPLDIIKNKTPSPSDLARKSGQEQVVANPIESPSAIKTAPVEKVSGEVNSYESYLKLNGLKDTPEERANFTGIIESSPVSSGVEKTEAKTIGDQNADTYTTEDTLKRSFFDELHKNKEALSSQGLNFYDYGSDKATAEQLEEVKKNNPKLYEEFLKNNGKLALEKQMTTKPEVTTSEPPTGIEQRSVELPKETTETVIREKVKESGLAKKNGEIDWDAIGKMAKDTGLGILGVLQAAIAGRVAGMQGRALDFDKETSLGRQAGIRERQEQLKAQQDEASASRQFTRDERIQQGLQNIAQMDKEQKFQATQKQLDREYAAGQAEIQRIENKTERDLASQRFQQEMNLKYKALEVQKNEQINAVKTAGGPITYIDPNKK